MGMSEIGCAAYPAQNELARDGTKPRLLKPFEKSRSGAAAFEAVIGLDEQFGELPRE